MLYPSNFNEEIGLFFVITVLVCIFMIFIFKWNSILKNIKPCSQESAFEKLEYLKNIFYRELFPLKTDTGIEISSFLKVF